MQGKPLSEGKFWRQAFYTRDGMKWYPGCSRFGLGALVVPSLSKTRLHRAPRFEPPALHEGALPGAAGQGCGREEMWFGKEQVGLAFSNPFLCRRERRDAGLGGPVGAHVHV